MDEMRLNIALYRTAKAWADNSTCPRGKVGAVLYVEKRPILCCYNGAAKGAEHCTDVGCDLQSVQGYESCVRAVHAEENIITFAAKLGLKTAEASVFCTHAACYNCARLMISAGIKQFTYVTPYKHAKGIDYLVRNGVDVKVFDTSAMAASELADAIATATAFVKTTGYGK